MTLTTWLNGPKSGSSFSTLTNANFLANTIFLLLTVQHRIIDYKASLISEIFRDNNKWEITMVRAHSNVTNNANSTLGIFQKNLKSCPTLAYKTLAKAFACKNLWWYQS